MDIVERLRDGVNRFYGNEPTGLMNEAADKIERLRWENANMEKLWGKSEGTWMEIRDNQDAEIERLREALEKVLSVQPIKGDEGSTDIVSLAKALLEIDTIARAALKEKE